MTMRKPRSEYPSEQADKFLLRFPDGMRDRLKAAAEANKRSMNAEIVSRLEVTLGDTNTYLLDRIFTHNKNFDLREVVSLAVQILFYGYSELTDAEKHSNLEVAKEKLLLIASELQQTINSEAPAEDLLKLRNRIVHAREFDADDPFGAT